MEMVVQITFREVLGGKRLMLRKLAAHYVWVVGVAKRMLRVPDS